MALEYAMFVYDVVLVCEEEVKDVIVLCGCSFFINHNYYQK